MNGYVLLHVDCNDNSILSINFEGKSLAYALVALKHHPCTRGELYSFLEYEVFDRKTAKLIATKKNSIISRHDIDEKRRKSIISVSDAV